MDYTKKKNELVTEFNTNQQVANELLARNKQIIGQIRLLEELEKEPQLPLEPVKPENNPKEEELPKINYDR